MNITKIKHNLSTKLIGKEILFFEKIDSTNNYLKNHNIETNGLVVVADNQTQGRGRGNRKWFSEPGKNLTFSILLIPEALDKNFFILPILTASTLAITIDNFCNVKTQTKWPNDLILNNKKLGGILIETAFTNNLKRIIIGIGLNVNQRFFPEEIHETATSLLLETEKEYDKDLLLSGLLNSIDQMYLRLLENDYLYYLEDWKKRCNHFGKKVTFERGTKIISGIAKDLSDDGSLVIEIDGKENKLISGEIILKNER